MSWGTSLHSAPARLIHQAGGPVAVAGGDAGVSLRTVRRRLSTISGLYAFLVARGDVALNPVPRGLPTRREGNRPSQGVPLVRAPRTLPRVLTPEEVDALTGRLRTHRDRAMVAAMVLGALRRCEVLGLRLEDLRCHLVELVGAYRPDEPRSTTNSSTPSTPRSLDTDHPHNGDVRALEEGQELPGSWTEPPNGGLVRACRQRAGLTGGRKVIRHPSR